MVPFPAIQPINMHHLTSVSYNFEGSLTVECAVDGQHDLYRILEFRVAQKKLLTIRLLTQTAFLWTTIMVMVAVGRTHTPRFDRGYCCHALLQSLRLFVC